MRYLSIALHVSALKRILPLIILFSFHVQHSFSQEIKTHIDLKRFSQIVTQVFIPNQATILLTGIPNQVGGKVTLDVRYFNTEGIQVWTKSVSMEYGYANRNVTLLASPNGQTIYVIQLPNRFNEKKHYISQFTIDGIEKRFEIQGNKDFGKSMQTVFCDNNFLYYLTTVEGYEKDRKGMELEKMILNRFNRNSFSYDRFVLELPVLDGDKSHFWSLIGQKEDEKFFASKIINVETGKSEYTIVPLNSQGKTGNKIVIETMLNDSKLPRPSFVRAKDAWFDSFVRLDYDYMTSQNYSNIPNQPSTTTTLGPNDGAYGQITYSGLHDCFYVFGLFGSIKLECEGFYIYKYNRAGNSVSKHQELASQELSKQLFKRYNAATYQFKFTPLVDGISAIIGLQEEGFPCVLTLDGKASWLTEIEGYNNIELSLTNTKKLKSIDFISTLGSSKKVDFQSFQNLNNELLFKFDQKERAIDIFNIQN